MGTWRPSARDSVEVLGPFLVEDSHGVQGGVQRPAPAEEEARRAPCMSFSVRFPRAPPWVLADATVSLRAPSEYGATGTVQIVATAARPEYGQGFHVSEPKPMVSSLATHNKPDLARPVAIKLSWPSHPDCDDRPGGEHLASGARPIASPRQSTRSKAQEPNEAGLSRAATSASCRGEAQLGLQPPAAPTTVFQAADPRRASGASALDSSRDRETPPLLLMPHQLTVELPTPPFVEFSTSSCSSWSTIGGFCRLPRRPSALGGGTGDMSRDMSREELRFAVPCEPRPVTPPTLLTPWDFELGPRAPTRPVIPPTPPPLPSVLTQSQLQDTLLYLLQNDDEFVDRIHRAYLHRSSGAESQAAHPQCRPR
ncbi:unnamed protein product [Lampetra fluviatilis]